MPLLHPLPPVGEPYKEAWGRMYDYYGNLLDKSSGAGVGGKYNWSIDHVYNAWMHFINKGFFDLHGGWENRIPMTVTHNARNVFNRLYGGFGFDSMMRLIKDRPDKLKRELNAEFKEWKSVAFADFFNEFCNENHILSIQIPENTLESIHDLFERGMENSVVEDFTNQMQYKIGIELKSGEFYEIAAFNLYYDWKFGYLAKDMAAAVVGLQSGMDEYFGTKRKRGWLEKTFFKARLERERRRATFSINIYNNANKRIASFNVLDIALFYPPPPGQPVSNPLL